MSELPFTTREPDIFQTEVVVRMGETERRMFVARSGEKRRIDYGVGTDAHRAVLITDKEYLLYFKRRVYSETAANDSEEAGSSATLSHLLHARDYTDFDEIGRDGAVVRFRARINESTAAEVIVFFDESIGLPIRHEFYSLEGDKRILQYSVELRGFRREAEDGLFQLPGNFRRESRTQQIVEQR